MTANSYSESSSKSSDGLDKEQCYQVSFIIMMIQLIIWNKCFVCVNNHMKRIGIQL